MTMNKRFSSIRAFLSGRFLKEISPFKAPKINRKELRAYLGAFPKTYSNKEIAFLMNGEYEMDAATLH